MKKIPSNEKEIIYKSSVRELVRCNLKKFSCKAYVSMKPIVSTQVLSCDLVTEYLLQKLKYSFTVSKFRLIAFQQHVL